MEHVTLHFVYYMYMYIIILTFAHSLPPRGHAQNPNVITVTCTIDKHNFKQKYIYLNNPLKLVYGSQGWNAG